MVKKNNNWNKNYYILNKEITLTKKKKKLWKSKKKNPISEGKIVELILYYPLQHSRDIMEE